MSNRRQHGGVAMFALIGSASMLTVGLGVASLGMQSMSRANRDTRAAASFQSAQAGLEIAITRAFTSLEANNGVFVSGTQNVGSEIAPMATGVSATTTVSPTSDPTRAWITCTASFKGMSKSVRAFIRSNNVGIWNNAIFAGTGAAGQSINGNVDIRGSVHILGEGESFSDLNNNGNWDAAEAFTDSNNNGVWDVGEPFTDTNNDGVRNSAEPYNDTNSNNAYDPPLTQTDLNSSFSGNGHIGNHYSGMPAGLEAQVPPPPLISGIETLSAEVRCKHGRIALSGSATVGTTSTIDGGSSKGKVDGTYVSDGFAGNQGASSVFSDNGTSNGYDLGNLGIKFPLISGIGAEQYFDGTTMWANQSAFLNARSLSIPVNTIVSTTNNFSYGPDIYGNSIVYTKAAGANPATLAITGRVKITGSLNLGTKNTTVRYTGNGTIFATDNIDIHCNLLPAAGQTFPTTARIGLIAENDLNLATGPGDSQLSMAGAFYAQGTIRSQKQNQIAGTFVANYYDMGNNVPNIYQVPTLPYNMPPSMPGDKKFFTLKVSTWRERAAN